MLDETLRAKTELDAIVTVVDARHVRMQLDNEQAREQVAFADVILVNKIDLVSDEEVATLVDMVRVLNPLAKVHKSKECSIDLQCVLGLRAFDLRNVLRLDPQLLTDSTHEHDSDITCVSICEGGAVDATSFNRWINALAQSSGKDLLRTKGIVDISGEARRLVFHGVHMTLDGRPGKPWGPTEPRTSQLVFIGRNLDERALRAGFAGCRADAATTHAVATAA
jgi:G3E family GTPase